jgi:hypothetical protein
MSTVIKTGLGTRDSGLGKQPNEFFVAKILADIFLQTFIMNIPASRLSLRAFNPESREKELHA